MSQETFIWIFVVGPFLAYFIYKVAKDLKENKIQRKAKETEKIETKKREQARVKSKKQDLENSLKKLKVLENNIKKLKEVEVVDISDFKEKLISVENSLVEKGTENKLFEFLKINTFLLDFKSEIEKGRDEIIDFVSISNLKSRVIEESKNDSLDKTIENLEDMISSFDGKKGQGFDAKLGLLFELSEKLVPVFMNEIKTLEFYKNIGLASIVFYLSDQKIKYFEINEGFEKLGVFDSTWQKNVLNKLDSIEIRLGEMNNQLTKLNQNFISIIDSSDDIISELKNINSSLMTNNLLQSITAFQVWRINSKL